MSDVGATWPLIVEKLLTEYLRSVYRFFSIRFDAAMLFALATKQFRLYSQMWSRLWVREECRSERRLERRTAARALCTRMGYEMNRERMKMTMVNRGRRRGTNPVQNEEEMGRTGKRRFGACGGDGGGGAS